MVRRFVSIALGAAAAGALCCAGAAHAQAQRTRPPAAQAQPRGANAEVTEYYDYYEVGYDSNYDDDWFFDYYAYDAAAFEPQYDYYSDYDYAADRFDWEEQGVFGGGADVETPDMQTPSPSRQWKGR